MAGRLILTGNLLYSVLASFTNHFLGEIAVGFKCPPCLSLNLHHQIDPKKEENQIG
jgi:hypothetical protein